MEGKDRGRLTPRWGGEHSWTESRWEPWGLRELDTALGDSEDSDFTFCDITNNLLVRAPLPGVKLFFDCCLREVPAAILQEKRAAGLRFVFLKGSEATLDSATREYLSRPGVTCSVREEGRGHSANMQLLSQNDQLLKGGVKEQLEMQKILTNYFILMSTEGRR